MDATSSRLPFADGEYTFFLPMARYIAAEREMGCSIFELFHNLGEHLAIVDDEEVLAGPSPATIPQCRALIRNGLIGGGLTEREAQDLVDVYCFPSRAAIYDMALAFKVLRAMIYGVRLHGGKKKSASTDKPEPFRKGQAIVNCAALGLDYYRASLSDYLEALEFHNDRSATDEPAKQPSEGLRRFIKAHTKPSVA